MLILIIKRYVIAGKYFEKYYEYDLRQNVEKSSFKLTNYNFLTPFNVM